MGISLLASCDQLGRHQPAAAPCLDCHAQDRARPLAPDHLAANFPTDCSQCHTTAGWRAGGASCTTCHGDAEHGAAPPLGTGGETGTTSRAVGAHQAHLLESSWRSRVACSDCHQVPTAAGDPGHTDTALPAEVTFGSLARAAGATPAWDGRACAGTYCHGATLSGGTQPAPLWALVDGSQSACGSCHGLPPGGDHPSSAACASCHGQVVNAARTIIAPALHINGKVEAAGAHPSGYASGSTHGPAFYADKASCQSCHGSSLTGGSARSCSDAGCHSAGWTATCTFCHGGGNSTGAPPAAVDGTTATSATTVGRHSSHVTASATHAAYPCDVCHGATPADAMTPGHVDPAPAEVRFAGFSANRGSYSGGSCTSLYCHGNGITPSGAISWTSSLGGGCTACHGMPSETGEHKKHWEKGYSCATCHQCVASSSNQIVDPARHVNGTKDVCGPSGWIPSSRSCDPSCHGLERW